MIELRDVEQEVSRFRLRLLAAALFVLLAFGLLAARLVHLQVFRHDELATQAEANRIAVVPIVPNRGLIVDRNGVVLATNYSAYTLEITPSKAPNLAQTIDAVGKRKCQQEEIVNPPAQHRPSGWSAPTAARTSAGRPGRAARASRCSPRTGASRWAAAATQAAHR